MSSLPLKLQTSENQSEVIVVAEEVADLSLKEGPTPVPPNLLKHFTHDHPLILEQNHGVLRDFVSTNSYTYCTGCKGTYIPPRDGPMYRCSNTECDEKSFMLHKSCAELPTNIVSTIHPEHLLELTLFSYPPKSSCDICQELIMCSFIYRCEPCNIHLDAKCASKHKFEPQCVHNDHSFILWKRAQFTCDACGVEEKEMVSYRCTTCQLQVHSHNESCSSSSSYPLKVKQSLHKHALILTYSFPLDFDFFHKSCMICNRKINRVSCVYYCSTCTYIAHVGCATSKKFIDEYEHQDDAECDIATNEISRLSGEGEDHKATKHFSPPHGFILSNDEPKIDDLCDRCALPISVPFYTSTVDQYNISIHKQCAELPDKIQHPLHNHLLTLEAKHPLNDIGYFECHGCGFPCNCFSYVCVNCNFSLDVPCSLFSETLIHEGHQCTLNLILDSDATKCSACGLPWHSKFVCRQCNFYVCLVCASLPIETMHTCPKSDWAIRPIKLTYSSVEHVADQYFCDLCEERRDKNNWFYYCEPCDYSLHPKCTVGENRIKCGKTYKFSQHPHPFTLLKKPKRNRTCVACNRPCEDSWRILVCADCDIYLHFNLACMYPL